jgi:thiol-disulfide isomerase/thioredoxin
MSPVKKVVLILLFGVPNVLLAQSDMFKSQRELIGKITDEIQVTHYLQNEPSDKNYNNKFKVLEFWATWCSPCLKAVPHLNRLQEKFRGQNIVFLSITYENPEKTLHTFQKVKFETVVVSTTTRAIHKKRKVQDNGTMSLPRTVLIDNENRIVWYGSPKELTENGIRKFLNGEPITDQQ